MFIHLICTIAQYIIFNFESLKEARQLFHISLSKKEYMFYISGNRATDSALLLRIFFGILVYQNCGKVFLGQVGNKLL